MRLILDKQLKKIRISLWSHKLTMRFFHRIYQTPFLFVFIVLNAKVFFDGILLLISFFLSHTMYDIYQPRLASV